MWKLLRKDKNEKVINDNFYVAFTFIPTLVELYNTGEYSDEMLKRKIIWVQLMESICDCKRKIRFDDFYLSCCNIGTKKKCYLVYIRFPKARIYMGIKEACIVVDKLHKHASYFTNEYRFESCMVCQQRNRRVRQMVGLCIPDSESPTLFLANTMKLDGYANSTQNRR